MKILLIVYDNGSHIPFFPQGIAYLEAKLNKEGHNVWVYNQDIQHYPESHLTAILDRDNFDAVGLGFVAGYYQYRKCKAISEAVNRSKNRGAFRYVLGGHGPAAAPEFFLNKFEADAVCIGEGEGFDFESNNAINQVAILKDVDSISMPVYDRWPISVYRLIRWPTSKESDFCMPVLSGRGCPYQCTFCYRMNAGDFRPRSPEAVIDEMRYLWTNCRWGINHFQFSDELFMSSESRIMEFCYKLLHIDIPNFKWDCNGRLNFAKPEILQFMKKAGCEYINYGIEALDDKVLKNIRKRLTVEQITVGVENTLRAGLIPGLNIMWGNIGDTEETLQKAVDFLIKYDTCVELRTIRPVTPYPGSELYRYAVHDGLLEGPEDFYERKHINSDLLTVNFTDIPDTDFHSMLYEANTRLFKHYQDLIYLKMNTGLSRFYSKDDTDFRGFRPI